MKKKLNIQQLRRLRRITIVGSFISVLMFGLGTLTQSSWLAWPAMAIMFGIVIVDIIFCRCPKCGCYIQLLSEERCFCIRCGKELD